MQETSISFDRPYDGHYEHDHFHEHDHHDHGHGHSHSHGHNHGQKFRSHDHDDSAKDFWSFSTMLAAILKDQDAKRLFYYILLLLGVTIIELVYGVKLQSLVLISVGFHSTFDCLTMTISLFAMVLAKQKPTKKYSYGFDRIEILSGFSNGVFLLFVSLFITKEALAALMEMGEEHDSLEQTESTTGAVFVISCLALAVNVLGVMFFKEHAHARSEVRSHAHEENMQSVLIHMVVDILACVMAILSAWLDSRGWVLADPLLALAMVGLIIYSALPICNRTARVLLQTSPLSIKDKLDKVLREASTLDGVLEYRNEHFWTQSPGVFVGSITLRVRSDVNEQLVRGKVHQLFEPYLRHFAVQVEKDEWQIPTN